MKRLTFVYYSIIALLLVSQAVYTVYRLGGTVGQGEKLKQMQNQQLSLEKELQTLQERRYGQQALAVITEEDTAGYQTIKKPIIISPLESVASR